MSTMQSNSAYMLRKNMIIKKFRECGATSEKSAKTLEEAGVVNYNAFQNIIDDLLNQNKLVKTKSGKYYLNVKK